MAASRRRSAGCPSMRTMGGAVAEVCPADQTFAREWGRSAVGRDGCCTSLLYGGRSCQGLGDLDLSRTQPWGICPTGATLTLPYQRGREGRRCHG
jgi:hypothetical protein